MLDKNMCQLAQRDTETVSLLTPIDGEQIEGAGVAAQADRTAWVAQDINGWRRGLAIFKHHCVATHRKACVSGQCFQRIDERNSPIVMHNHGRTQV